MEFPFDQQIIDSKIVRTFSPDVELDELKWHQDLKNRYVTIVEPGGWKYQTDNSLPVDLSKDQIIEIPKMTWHRVIRGNEKLVVEIVELD